MAFLWFAEQFGLDHASQRTEIERLLKLGRPRKDGRDKAHTLQMIVIEPNGKPRRGEPTRIARALTVPIQRVRDWIEDFQRAVDYLVEHGRVSRAQAWDSIKNPSSWAAVERGIQRSKVGRHAGSGKRRRSGW